MKLMEASAFTAVAVTNTSTLPPKAATSPEPTQPGSDGPSRTNSHNSSQDGGGGAGSDCKTDSGDVPTAFPTEPKSNNGKLPYEMPRITVQEVTNV